MRLNGIKLVCGPHEINGASEYFRRPGLASYFKHPQISSIRYRLSILINANPIVLIIVCFIYQSTKAIVDV